MLLFLHGRPYAGRPFMTSWRERSDLHKTTAPFEIDCCAFAGRFDERLWTAHLGRWQQLRERCLFVVAPDVVRDAAATQAQYEQYRRVVRGLGYRVAFVAQDGQMVGALPVDYDCLFIGGSTEFKFSEECQQLVSAARRAGKWVHMGRVNSLRRVRFCKWLGCDSVDGTRANYSPDVNLPQIDGWIAQAVLWEAN